MKSYLFAGAGVGAVLLGLAGWHLVQSPARAAAESLEAVNGITVRQTTEADLLRRPQFQTVDRHCFEADCVYHIETVNSLLSTLHLAPRTQMSAIVMVRDSVVTQVSVRIWRKGMPGLSLNQVSDMPGCKSSPCVRDLIPPNGVLAGTSIMFNSQSDIRNHMPRAVDSACLSRLQGCETNAELMPVLREIKMESARPWPQPGRSAASAK